MEQGQAAPWRVILFSDDAFVVGAWAQLLPAFGLQLVAVVTSARRNANYLSVVGAAGPGVDVLVSDRRRAWAAMLAPLRASTTIAIALNTFDLSDEDARAAIAAAEAETGLPATDPVRYDPKPIVDAIVAFHQSRVGATAAA